MAKPKQEVRTPKEINKDKVFLDKQITMLETVLSSRSATSVAGYKAALTEINPYIIPEPPLPEETKNPLDLNFPAVPNLPALREHIRNLDHQYPGCSIRWVNNRATLHFTKPRLETTEEVERRYKHILFQTCESELKTLRDVREVYKKEYEASLTYSVRQRKLGSVFDQLKQFQDITITINNKKQEVRDRISFLHALYKMPLDNDIRIVATNHIITYIKTYTASSKKWQTKTIDGMRREFEIQRLEQLLNVYKSCDMANGWGFIREGEFDDRY